MNYTDITHLIRNNQFSEAREALGKMPLPNGGLPAAEHQHLHGVLELFDENYEKAIEYLEKAVVLRAEPRFYNNLGEAQRRAKLFDAASVSFKKALNLKPDYDDAHYNLGVNEFDRRDFKAAHKIFNEALKEQIKKNGTRQIILKNAIADCIRELGLFKEAFQLYTVLINEDDNNLKAHINIAPLYLHRGELDLAIQHCEKALSIKSDDITALINLGRCLVEKEDLDGAMEVYGKAHDLHPDSLELNSAIAKIWLLVGDFKEALFWFQKALTINADFVEAKIGLSSVFRELGNVEGALNSINAVLEQDENNVEALLEKSQILWDDGDAEEAILLLQKAIALRPEAPALYARMGSILSSSGETQEAILVNEKALEINANCIPALTNIVTTLKAKSEPEVISSIEHLITKHENKEGVLSNLHNALAHYYDGKKEYGKAAEHAIQGNKLQWSFKSKRGWEYKAEDYSQYIDEVCTVFSKEFFEERKGWGSDSNLPTFIVGMPRSGTTLTEQVLANHENILGIGERNFASKFLDSVRVLKNNKKEPLSQVAKLTKDDVNDIAQNYLAELDKMVVKSGKKNVQFVVDKMPDNYSQVGWIHLLFPNANIIYAQRDLRDVAVSCWITQFKNIQWACDPENIAKRIGDHIKVMKHWDLALPNVVYRTHYEDLVANQAEKTADLLSLLSLPFDDKCLEFYKSDRLVRTASVSQVRKPIYKDSLKRWKAYEKEIEPVCALLEKLQYYSD